MKLSEKAYINKIGVRGHAIVDLVLLIAYAIELAKGARTPLYFAVFSVFCIGPVLAEFIIMSKNKESGAIKHIICSGYSALYLFVLFTSSSELVFTYAFPMYMIVILYMDVKLAALIATGGFLGNVISIAIYAAGVGYTLEEMANVEIRIAAMLLTGIFMLVSCLVVSKVNREKLVQVQEKSEAANALANQVLDVSQAMITDIRDVSEKTVKLGESVSHIHESMNEVSVGSNETAESVQIQLQRTEQIQEHIVHVKNTTAQIEKDIEETGEKVEEGKRYMDALGEQVAKSMDANAQVLERMRELGEYTSRMNTIIEAITSIANSTGMLALNASIEAARAGEAGRGFAVVAGQISGLANQTKEATVNITSLIENINTELIAVEEAIEVVTESNRANSESTQIVTDSFSGITNGTENVGRNTRELLEIVSSLETANADIVENIQTISAITEEVSAHAGETYEACEENSLLVSNMAEIVGKLTEEAEKLQAVK